MYGGSQNQQETDEQRIARQMKEQQDWAMQNVREGNHMSDAQLNQSSYNGNNTYGSADSSGEGSVGNLFNTRSALYGGNATAAQQNLNQIWQTQQSEGINAINATNAINTGLAASGQQIGQTATAANNLLGYAGGNVAANGDLYSNRINAVAGPSQTGTQAEQQAIGGLQQFAGQTAPASVAQQQLAQATNANMANAVALGNSGRGAGVNGAAQSAAQAQALSANSQGAQQAAILRAQEEQAWRVQQMQAMQAAGTLGGNVQAQALQQQQQEVARQSAASNAMLGYSQLDQQYNQGVSNNMFNAQQMNQQNLSTYANTQMTAAQQQSAAMQAAIQAQQNQLNAEAQMRVGGIGSANATKAGLTTSAAQIAQQEKAANEAMYGTALTVGGAVVGGLLGGPGGAVAGGAAGNQAVKA
jgi:hypothetical protein